ncbi:MAG: hypothetical protein EOP49_33875, partial [Sphingobacteriales bacterium]
MNQFNKRKKQLLMIGLVSLASMQSFAQMSQTFVRAVASSSDDVEETIAGGTGTVGAMDITSSDLELMLDGTKRQIIGVKFSSLFIPQGATITRAYVQFSTKGDKTPILGDMYITAQAIDNAPTFTTANFNLSSRAQVSDSVLWAGSTNSSWGTSGGGTADVNQRTPNINTVLQSVINRPGWAPGNSVVVIFKGEGVRNTSSVDNGAAVAPKLIIEYTSSAISPLLAGSLPVAKLSDWKYLDNGTTPAGWNTTGFTDGGWSYGPAKAGYGLNPTTTVSFGSDPNNKHIT